MELFTKLDQEIRQLREKKSALFEFLKNSEVRPTIKKNAVETMEQNNQGPAYAEI